MKYYENFQQQKLKLDIIIAALKLICPDIIYNRSDALSIKNKVIGYCYVNENDIEVDIYEQKNIKVQTHIDNIAEYLKTIPNLKLKVHKVYRPLTKQQIAIVARNLPNNLFSVD